MTSIREIIKIPGETNKGVSNECPHGTCQESDPLTSDELYQVLVIIVYAVLCSTISVLGSAANIINIIVFFKQGFNDSVNISLCCLSISDLGLLSCVMWISLCFNPLFQYSEIEFDSVQVQYLTAGEPCTCFARITSWITASITFERCVCIALPLKVKDIITPKLTFISVVVIFLVMAASVTPVFWSVHLGQSFNDKRNKTLIVLLYDNNAAEFENIFFSINVFVEIVSFITVIVCTVILIYNFQVKSKWRKKAVADSYLNKSNSISSRDKRIMKMVTFVSCIFILCYLPDAFVTILAIYFQQDYGMEGRYQNSLKVSWAVVNTFVSVNSSINILVYYNMSSKYRNYFKKLFKYDDLVH